MQTNKSDICGVYAMIAAKFMDKKNYIESFNNYINKSLDEHTKTGKEKMDEISEIMKEIN